MEYVIVLGLAAAVVYFAMRVANKSKDKTGAGADKAGDKNNKLR